MTNLTVVEHVYWQDSQDQPRAVESVYSRRLQTQEQPFGPRILTVNGDWRTIETGWLEQGSLLCIANEEGKRLEAIPDDDQKADIAKRVVEVTWENPVIGNGFPCWLVRPGESMRAEPSDLAKVRMRCRHQTARVVINVMPQ